MPNTLSAPLRNLLQAIQGDPTLMDRLQNPRSNGSEAGDRLDDDLAALLRDLAAVGRIPALEVEASLAAQQLVGELTALLADVHPLTDEQLEAVAAGRMSAGALLCTLASSLAIGASDGVAFLAASAPQASLASPVAMAPRQRTVAERPVWLAPALEIIKEFEGLELEAYVDAVGVVTIGWGTTRYEDGCSVKLGDTITEQRAEELLIGSILREYGPGVFEALPMASAMAPRQQAALVSFTYNVGVEALKDSTLRRRLVAGELAETVIRQELPRWCFGDAGEQLAGLVRRRAAEVALFTAG